MDIAEDTTNSDERLIARQRILLQSLIYPIAGSREGQVRESWTAVCCEINKSYLISIKKFC